VNRSILVHLCVLSIAASGLPACGTRDQEAQPASALPPDTLPQASEAPPTLDEVRNATYRGLEIADGPVTLVDGAWEGEPVDGGAARPRVTVAPDFLLLGDVDGDGSDEAIVLLSASGGGSGDFLYVAVVDRHDGKVENTGTALLGDRVQVRDARLEDGRMLFDIVQAGPDDAMCCPGELVTRGWHLRPGGLEEFVTSTKSGRLSLETIAGTEWVLRNWSWDEPAPPAPEVTLAVQGGRFVGSAGCNRYFAAATPGTAPGDVSVGPAGATRMMCPEAAMQVEDRFLEQLSSTVKYGFVFGRLALTYKIADGVSTMLFAPGETSPVEP